MRRLRQIRHRPHACAVGAERHHAACCQEFHRIRIGIGIARSFAIHHIGNVAMTFRKWTIIRVGVVAAEQDDVAEFQSPMLLFKSFDVGWQNKRADSVRSLIEQISDIDNAGFTTKLPGFNLCRCKPDRTDRTSRASIPAARRNAAAHPVAFPCFRRSATRRCCMDCSARSSVRGSIEIEEMDASATCRVLRCDEQRAIDKPCCRVVLILSAQIGSKGTARSKEYAKDKGS